MFDVPDPTWPVIVLAVILGGDALVSMRPPALIRDCLTSVNLPRDYWWALIWIKIVAVAGLVVGIWQPGVGVAATAGVIAYFLAASYTHIRARALGQAFWVNCLGMLGISTAVLLYSFVF
ncbi:MAG: hypothetical protein GX542_06610 [Rhodococcus sp.]|nr:hypothetical protein [Rhodococcus sp. (in: high G+C Gram-positive bacteria)]